MESTLETFIAEVATLFNKDFDYAFKKQIESSIIGFRATLLKQEYDKNGRFPTASIDAFCLPLQQAKAIDCCLTDEVDCFVQRTIDKVPAPVRTNRNAIPFLFIGTTNQERSFTFSNPENIANIQEGTRFISKDYFYAYYNDYIYTFNYEGGSIGIRSVFANRTEVAKLKGCGGNPCIEVVRIEEDMKKTIRQMIIEDFRGIGIVPQDKEIRIDEP
jgi:hypothetical protein